MTTPPNVEPRVRTRGRQTTALQSHQLIWADAGIFIAILRQHVQTILVGSSSTVIPGIYPACYRNTPVFAKELLTKNFLGSTSLFDYIFGVMSCPAWRLHS
jgi:hypothetical protein